MLFRGSKNIFWRTLLLVGAVICFFKALVKGLLLRLIFANEHTYLAMGALVVFSFLIIRGIQRFGGLFHTLEGHHLPARVGRTLYPVMALLIVNGLLEEIIDFVPKNLLVLNRSAWLSLALGLQLFWLALLDWPRSARTKLSHKTYLKSHRFQDPRLGSKLLPVRFRKPQKNSADVPTLGKTQR